MHHNPQFLLLFLVCVEVGDEAADFAESDGNMSVEVEYEHLDDKADFMAKMQIPGQCGSSICVDLPAREDTDVREGLPFLFSQEEISPVERTRQYWEWCYGKGATIELAGSKGAWSAKRDAPTKGW